ncbi:ribosome hibernation-promoting factor, HPF/YfiA family [Jatrophihabitans sp.]|uniref:ribosome hibernation-promoting factor, HPF/YfiA family n=1 Tax=Jatrophihabitans sp. TaxID=1932789 RepID=UPI002CBCCD15|nr:ribosome-associated translation inhibitor RaiA [Jatrophihabitans sp.]
MDIVVRGRNVEVPDHYRQHVAEKLAKVERYDQRIFRADVELLHEKNPRQSEICQRVEITCRARGPVVRVEACAADFYKALDLAVERLARKFRQSADRRRVHHGRHTPTSVAAATGALIEPEAFIASRPDDEPALDDELTDGPGQVVRIKEHPAKPMTVDQALFEMELVGHDFYLFADADGGHPSVVYRRKGYDYGVIRLVE